MSYGKIGLTTVAVTQDLLSWMPLVLKIELIRLWYSILPESEQPSAQLSKLIRLTAFKKAMHATSRWYRTVYIPWLVASYDTHKGKRLLNSNPPNHRGKIIIIITLRVIDKLEHYSHKRTLPVLCVFLDLITSLLLGRCVVRSTVFSVRIVEYLYS